MSTFDPRTDESLLRAYYEGEAAAFSTLYQRHERATLRHLHKYLDEEDAREVLQDIFAAVAAQRWTNRGAPFAHWLSRTTRNAAITRWRQRTTQRRLARALRERAERAASPDPHDTVLGRRVARALERMPEHYRRLIVLRDLQGLSYAEIGALLKIPVQLVTTRLHQARQMARRFLATAYAQVNA